MITLFKKWFNALFPEEEFIILLLILIGGLTIVITMGNIVAPIIISIILAFLMSGITTRLIAHGTPHWLALALVFLIFVGTFLGLLLVVLPLVWEQMTHLANELPRMAVQWQQALSLLPEKYPSLVSEQQLEQWLSVARAQLTTIGQSILSFSIANIPALIVLIVYTILVPILVLFLLKDYPVIMRWLGHFLPVKRPILTRVWHEMKAQMGNYVRGKVIEIVIVGIVSYLTFIALGLNYAALLGLCVGLSVLIPYIGAITITIPIAMVGFFQWGLSPSFYTLLAAYFVIQALDGNVLAPLLFSEVVDLHPVAIIVAILVFGGWWGFWGVFFAIPLATLIKAVIDAWPHSRAHRDVLVASPGKTMVKDS